jgi:Predicted oxidoreductase related to nitroreductase
LLSNGACPLNGDWVAQLVFGSPEAQAGEKTYKPIEDRVKIFGKL